MDYLVVVFVLGGRRGDRPVRRLEDHEDAVNHDGLLEARKRVLPKPREERVAPPSVLSLEYHIGEVLIFYYIPFLVEQSRL